MDTNPSNKTPEIKPTLPQSKNSEDNNGQKGPLFFNVMPKAKMSDNGSVVQPSLTVDGGLSVDDDKPSFITKHKIALIILCAILIFTPIAYFFANRYLNNLYKPENFLVTQPEKKQPNTEESTATTSAEAIQISTPKEWQKKYFNAEVCADIAVCGDNADPDKDGLTNLEEYKLQTDPNNNDSDQDGLADGDEVNVFGTDPLNANTAKDLKYNDADYIKGGYDIKTGKKMTAGQIQEIKSKMDEKGLHQPTLTTLGDYLNKVYNFGASADGQSQTSTSTLANIDMSLESKQDRDAQRTNTIKNIGIALIKYQTDSHLFPQTTDFKDMYNQIKPYLKIATNPEDPINKDPYVYSYTSTASGTDFTLIFYSEIAGQIIKKTATDAQKDKTQEEANIFDDQRKNDLQTLRTALLLYSANNIAGNQDYVFPSVDKYKTELVPNYITTIPKDPKTTADYEYQVGESFNTFTLKAALDNPVIGTTGYLCNQEECRNY